MKRQSILPNVCLLLFFAVVIGRNAWLCEDSYITFRTVENFVNGYGLRWNIVERVQTYTNPLWMFCISAVFALTREMYFSALFFSMAVSIAAVWVLSFKIARPGIQVVLGVMIFVFSKAFVDFSTSGLENPLIHLLLAIFFLCYYRFETLPAEAQRPKQLFLLSFVAALVVLNRMDTFLIVVLPLGHVFWRTWRPRAPFGRNFLITGLAAGAGFFPFILWELFSVFYYGFLFPNTAYAKLSSGILQAERLEQGWYYLLNSLTWDPLTLFIILSVLAYTIAFFRQNRFHGVMGLGLLLYLIYVVRIGGDFMSGRFLTAPLFCAVLVLVRIPLKPLSQGAVLGSLILLLGLNAPTPTIQNYESKEKRVDGRGISDGRSRDAQGSGLFQANRNVFLPSNDRTERAEKLAEEGKQVTIEPAVGFFGFAAGPAMHIIDTLGLGDPLLARLPTILIRGDWMIAHFYRDVPAGYPESALGKNVIADPSLAQYWDKLAFVTRGPLFSLARFEEIVRFNLGRYDHLLAEYCFRNYFIEYTREVRIQKKAGTPWNAPGNYRLNQYGLGISLKNIKAEDLHALSRFSMSAQGGEKYVIGYYQNGAEIARQAVALPPSRTGGLVLYQDHFPPAALQQGFNLVRILPAAQPNKHSVGHFRLEFSPVVKRLAEFGAPKAEGTYWAAAGNFVFERRELLLELENVSHASQIEISADSNDQYLITYLRDHATVGKTVVPIAETAKGGLSVQTLAVPPEAIGQGYDKLLIAPVEGDGRCSIGHVRLRE